jgi:hypothetical protein
MSPQSVTIPDGNRAQARLDEAVVFRYRFCFD